MPSPFQAIKVGSALGAAAGSVRPVTASACTGVSAKITSSLRLARSPRWSQVGSMVMPGASDRTRKPPTLGVGSSVLAQTTIQRKPTAPVEKIFRPVRDQPPGTRRAVVAGSPPRAGVPSSGSTRSALIRTGRDTDSATTSAYSAAGHVSCRACAACCSSVIAVIRATDGSPRPSACRMADGLGQSRAGAAVAFGNGRRQQAGRVDGLDPRGGERPGPVILLGARGQRRRHLGQAAEIEHLVAHADRAVGPDPTGVAACTRSSSTSFPPGPVSLVTPIHSRSS